MKPGDNNASVIISGNDFPEVEGCMVLDCKIICHVKTTEFEVVKVD